MVYLRTNKENNMKMNEIITITLDTPIYDYITMDSILQAVKKELRGNILDIKILKIEGLYSGISIQEER
jgi:hypothetical protein